MNINVTRTEVIVGNGYIVNKGEYKINSCVFTFSQEYTSNLVKKAVFDDGKTTKEMAIINNRCEIPYEVLDSDSFELRVYAYRVNGEELELVYSPTPAIIYLREGSYRGVTGSGEIITPTQYEQYEQALNDGLDDLESGLQDLESGLEEVSNVDIDVSKSGNTATVIITNRLGTEKSVEIFDGDDYVLTEEDKQEIINTVEAEVSLDIPTKVSQLENDSAYINKEVNNLTNYTLKTNTGSSIELSINNSTYVMTLNLKNSAGTTISTGTIDLPLETMVVGATYDNVNKKIVLTLKNGSTIDVPVADLISGLQSEITNANKLSADLVDDTSTIHKFTSTSEKSSWNAKYDKPSGGIPSTDLSSSVQTSLGKADTAIQDVSGKEDKTNKTSTIDENSTNTQYPNAKVVYDNLVLRDEEISDLKTKNEMLINDHVTVTAKNTEIQLTGTGDLPMELVPYGNISQETREGYNLIKNNNVNGIIVNANNISGEGSYLALADVEAETDYTISLKKSRISGVTISNSTLYKVARIEFYNNSTFLSRIEGDTTTFSSGSRALLNIFTTPTNCNNVKISLFNNNGDSNYNTLVEEVMLVKGTYTAETIPNFEPYGAMPSLDYESPVKVVDENYTITVANSDDTQTQTKTIDTSSNPLYSENDCYKYLTSEQAIALGLNTGAGWYVYNEYYNQNFASGVSSVTIATMKFNGTFYSTVGGTVSGTTITFSGTTTGEGNIVYELATPTYTKITDTDLINSLEALKDMQSYYDVTNISQTHSDGQADMIINAKALKSLKAMQSEIDELKQAVLNS